MLKAGLTGNIGSGKTTVAKVFCSFGMPVFDADEQAKMALNESRQQEKLIARFGPEVIGSDKKIDKKYFARLIFNDPAALDYVNTLTHPIVRQRFFDFCEKHAGAACCLYEAAIIIETGFYKQLDKTILVTAPEALRIQRVKERDKVSEEAIRQRMKNQWPEEQKKTLADFVIVNDEKLPLLEQCLEVYKKMV